MNDKPLVSIITPSFNQGKYLERTIQSVLNQDYPNIEYFILDGGSVDQSVQIIKKYSDRLSGWVSQKDKGQTDAINRGFSLAKGEIFAWINSDDTLEPHAVSDAVSFLKANPSIGLVYGDCNFMNTEDKIIGKFDARQTDLKKLQRGYVHIPQQASFFRAGLWKKVEPLDDSFYFAMDYDLWVRLAKITKIQYFPGHTWGNFRLHADMKTILADDRCWKEMLRVHRRNGGSVFSIIYLKYLLRKLAAPYLIQKRMQMFQQ